MTDWETHNPKPDNDSYGAWRARTMKSERDLQKVLALTFIVGWVVPCLAFIIGKFIM